MSKIQWEDWKVAFVPGLSYEIQVKPLDCPATKWFYDLYDRDGYEVYTSYTSEPFSSAELAMQDATERCKSILTGWNEYLVKNHRKPIELLD